jgi:hypothetical protein
VTTPPLEPIDAIAAWVDRNSQRAQKDAVQLTLRTGHVPDGSRRKATLGLQRGDRLALIEAWSSGEMDFTLHDFSVGEEGQTKHSQCTTFEDFDAAVDTCYMEFQGQGSGA